MPLEEPTYEPLGRPKRRRRGDCAIDSQGQLVEYERGYLRHQAKVARGVASPEPDASRRRARSEGIHPAVDPGSRIEIIYVLDLDRVPRALSAELPLELWWRGATAGGDGASSPLRPLCADAETTVPTERDCRLLSQLWRWRERGAGVRGNRFLIPPEAQSGILTQLGEVPNLRWSARRSDGAWRLHRLEIRPLGGKSLWSVSFPEGPAPQIMLSAMASDLPFEQWQALSSGGWAMAGGCIYFIGIRQAFGVLAPWIGGKPPALTPTQRSEFIRILTMDGGADLGGLPEALLDRQVDDLDGRYHEILAGMEVENAAAPPPFAPPEQFLARLRPYQNAGAAWLAALARRGINGILADDMGLGKTVEVLAVLAARHFETPRPPSLIVAPSSLLFNWQQESARFAPFLKVSQYHGPHRKCDPEWFSRFDLVLTTYGTLRQDAARLAAIDFDCVVLDESQNIKNAQSLTAQSARVLKTSRRIAMTGTPIENHLSELFSQLSFLNPGLFTAPLVQALGKEGGVLRDPGTARRMRRCLQPFILRRTKEQVATDLPAKTEQVIGCELPPEQRRHYDELREYYRQELSGMAGGQPGGGGTATMLAALLRLRQAACHAALIDPAMEAVPSAKLQLLHDHLGALLESGHKALVFSQFTSLLKLAAKDFECSGWKYCYLDGTTRDRGELVQRFQGDSSVGIFLISLKAGGVGLNLTAADYVYLLDPWWNPAAEAQAIDRAYRIGQRRPVFAYRLIARDTVEEKVMIMQRKKRAIANAVISAVPQDALDAPPPSLTAEDLRSLLDLG